MIKLHGGDCDGEKTKHGGNSMKEEAGKSFCGIYTTHAAVTAIVQAAVIIIPSVLL